MIFMRLLTLFSFLVLFFEVQAQEAEIVVREKIAGISLVAERFAVDSSHIEPLVKVGASYVAVIPFSFMPHIDSGALYFNHKQQWVSEREEGVRIAIRECKKKQLRVMLKPQIWVSHGEYTGNIKMNSEDQWKTFERDYTSYIVAFAKLAEEEEVDMMCIGTELKSVVAARPDFFGQLIEKVKIWYTGKLTYAENWDCYDKVNFWGQLDYIGVDAYFPISKKKKPCLKDLKEGWQPWINELDSVAQKWDKQIVFTEFGYRSIEGCAIEPWDYSNKHVTISEKQQLLALKALFETVWTERFFSGGFLWKWYPNHKEAGGSKDGMFTVQNKNAQRLVESYYE